MMTRNKYLKELRSFLGKLPKEDRKRILEFYNELIDDKLEAGQSEEEILGEFGSPEELAKQIFQDNGQTYSPPNTTSRIMRISAIVLGSPHLALAAGGIPGFSVRAVFSFVGGRGFLLVLRFRVWHSGNRRGCRLHSDAVFHRPAGGGLFPAGHFPGRRRLGAFDRHGDA